MRLAVAQSPILADPQANAAAITDLIARAAAAGARLVHFPEAALSGYVKSEIRSWADVDWAELDGALDRVREACAAHRVWAAVGCNHREEGLRRPLNAIHVISDRGEFAGRYDKRFCSNTEINDWYAAGRELLVVEIDGLRFGFLLCIEVNFPELVQEYERLDVDCLLLSAYAEDPIFRVIAEGHAACNCLFVSYSVPANASAAQPSAFIGPDGKILGSCVPGKVDLLVMEIDSGDARWDIPLRKARPWRRHARMGEIYAVYRLCGTRADSVD